MSKLIVCADDSPTIQVALKVHLTQAGYRVRMFPNGAEALAASQAELPDLILSDISMPVMDGYELCAKLKNSDRTASVPVMLFTRLNEATDILRGLEAGADAFIVKGGAPETLLERVALLMSEEETEQRRAAVRDFGEKLNLTGGREQIFKLLFEALSTEVAFDIMVLLVKPTEGPVPFVTVSKQPLGETIIDWLLKEVLTTVDRLADWQPPKDGIRIRAIVLQEDAPSMESTVMRGKVKVPLLDNSSFVGVLGMFAAETTDKFEQNIRFFFDIGMQSAQTLRRISVK